MDHFNWITLIVFSFDIDYFLGICFFLRGEGDYIEWHMLTDELV